MYTDTEGIIFRQVKTTGNRRMVLLFSKKYGKISAGTSISEKGRSKSSLAMKPFTYGRYELYKGRETYNINGADVIRSFYRIGEDVEKYMSCSYVLEFTEKLLQEDAPAADLFSLLIDFLELIEKRNKKYDSLVAAYQVKSLQCSGTMPEIRACVSCGKREDLNYFSIKEGGVLCDTCKLAARENDGLIYQINFGIVDVLSYMLSNPLKSFGNLALDDVLLKQLKKILKSYSAYHLDIKELKSESFLGD